VQGKDEFGILVQSFNDMTRKIREAQDQIKRSRAEAEMQHTYLQTVLTHLSSGVLSFNGRNCLRTHNAAAAQILRVDLEPLKGKSLTALARSHAELAGFCKAVRAAMEQGRDEWQTEAMLPGQGGRRTLIVRGTMLPGPRRRKGGYVLVFDDVTALIQAERDAAWREIARRLAHEIKNPLTPIQLSAERIRHKCMPALADTEQRTLERSTHTIIEQVEALKSMVNAFTDYARPVYMQPGPMDLNALIREVIELYGAEVLDTATGTTTPNRSRAARRRRAKGTVPLTVKLELDPRLPAIYADGGRLRQVLHNLLLNAREALVSQEVPTIRIHTHEVANDYGASVHLIVEDNGPGIPDQLMDNLFEPYVTTREKGTGLGLAIVKKIIEEHNGILEAENLAGGGARITITLPLAEAVSAEDDTRRPVRVVASREKRA
jgi:nitrogen fixation/metabolism regulation signal transduction histidine kinase